jgi:transcriptional regulator with XRE-family HTH domain
MKPRRRLPARNPHPKYPNLRAYMQMTGDTQEAIAAALGISQAHISRILAGKTVPRAELAIRLAAYADIPIDSFTWAAARLKGAVA